MFHTLSEVSALTGKSLASLRKQVTRGVLPTVIQDGKHYVTDETLHGLLGGKAHAMTYASLKAAWLAEMKAGLQTGKPASPRYIQALEYGVSLVEAKSQATGLDAISDTGLRECIAALVPDYESRRCHFSQKDQAKKALTSFCQYLVAQELKTELDLAKIKAVKIKRVFPPPVNKLTGTEVAALLKLVGERKYAADYDKALNRIIIMLGVEVGLRRSEFIRLDVNDVHLSESYIVLRDAKGQKTREPGMTPALKRELKQWLKYRAAIPSQQALLTLANGERITADAIRHRIKRMSESLGIKFTPHGLRKSFATIGVTERGMPLPVAQNTLGHTRIETTDAYIQTTALEARKWLQKSN